MEEKARADVAQGALRDLLDEETVITTVSLQNQRSLFTLRRTNIVAITTNTKWSFEFLMEEEGVAWVRSAKGPDGSNYLVPKYPMAIWDWFSGPEKSALDAVIAQAITSSIPR